MKNASSQLNRKPVICNFIHKSAKGSRFAGGPDFPRTGLMKSRLPLGNTRIYDLVRGLISIQVRASQSREYSIEGFMKMASRHSNRNQLFDYNSLAASELDDLA